jgi:hypothetical protein
MTEPSEHVPQEVEAPLSARVAAVEAHLRNLESEIEQIRNEIIGADSTKLDVGPLHLSGPGKWISVMIVAMSIAYAGAKGAFVELWGMLTK